MRGALLIALVIMSILVVPPLVFGFLTEPEAVIAAVYSFVAAAIVGVFAPQLAPWVSPKKRSSV